MPPGLLEFIVFILGMVVGWFVKGPVEWPVYGDVPVAHPFSTLPIVSAGQSVTVAFVKGDEIQSYRVVEAKDLKEILQTPKGDSPDSEYRFSHVDSRGSFVYVFERSLNE